MMSLKDSNKSHTPQIGAYKRQNSSRMRINYNNIISSGRRMSSESRNQINSKEESKLQVNENIFIQSHT